MEAGFMDNSLLLRVFGAVVIAALTRLACRYTRRGEEPPPADAPPVPNYIFEFDPSGVREGKRALE